MLPMLERILPGSISLLAAPDKPASFIDITVHCLCDWSCCRSYRFTKINFGNPINEIEGHIKLGFDDCLARAIYVTHFGSSINFISQSCEAPIKPASSARG